MLHEIPPTDCTDARAAASARVDGELSELEAGRLEAHLRDCRACADYAESVRGLALRLRGAELEQPSARLFVPRRRRPALRLSAAAAAVALVAAAGSAFAVGHVVGSRGGPAATIGSTVAPAAHQRSEVLGMVRRGRLGRMSTNDVIPV